ncbi:MAG: helix-turn-helix domain-containing protein [Candidatus Sericytochromatia bacterium]
MSRGRKIKIEIKESLEEIKKLYRKESDGETKIRLLAIIHLKEGKNGSEISKLLKIKQRTLYNWIKFYKEEGIGRLKTQKASGRPAKLSEEKRKKYKI